MNNNGYKYSIGAVIENREVSKGIFKINVKGNFLGKPGQFYMLKSWETDPILWRPVSIHNVNDQGIEFLYQVVGKGTEHLSKLTKGDELKLIGPLGNGFNIEELKGKKVALITGGIGVAPMNYVGTSLKESTIDVYSGFRNEVYGIDELERISENLHIATEDGNIGYKGYVTDIFKPEEYDVVLCCGPEIMMYKILKMCKDVGTKIYVSEEKKMACGIGACLVCTCKTIHGNKRTCKDGPVFSGEDFNVKELIC